MATDGKLREATLHLMIIRMSRLLMEELNEKFKGERNSLKEDSFVFSSSSALLLKKTYRFLSKFSRLFKIITIITFEQNYYLRLP